MGSNPKISVVTVCFNAVNYIEKTIESVLCQTFEDYEYLIIDGGSTDGTLDIIRSYEGNVHIRWISEPDKGIYDAMNKGIAMASGEWLNMMNAGDCFASNDVLEKIFKEQYSKDTSFIYSDRYVKNNGVISLSKHDHEKKKINHQSSIYRRSLHDKFGYYIVTPKIIVSDLLFFLAIPKNEFKKVDTIIAMTDAGGVSSGIWCIEQEVCARVVFREYTFGQMLIHYISKRIKKAFHII